MLFSAIFYDKYSESYGVLEEAAPPAPLSNSLREIEKIAKILFEDMFKIDYFKTKTLIKIENLVGLVMPVKGEHLCQTQVHDICV